MVETTPPPHRTIARPREAVDPISRERVCEAFRGWLDGRKEDGINEAQLALAADALSEIVVLRTQRYDDWWIRNAYRFDKTMREIERRRIRILLRGFIADFSLGKVELP